jgi:hypothetical protein
LRLLEEQRQQLSAVSSERENEVARRTLELSKVVEEREQRLMAIQAQAKHDIETASTLAQSALKERDDLKAKLERVERERLNLTHDKDTMETHLRRQFDNLLAQCSERDAAIHALHEQSRQNEAAASKLISELREDVAARDKASMDSERRLREAVDSADKTARAHVDSSRRESSTRLAKADEQILVLQKTVSRLEQDLRDREVAMTESRIAAQEQMMEVERQRQREEDDRMEALNERIRGIQQAQESWEMLKAQQAEELRLMRDSEARRNDEFAVLLRQENERRAELDSKFAASETRRMHLERERIEINARCDSLTQQVKSSESQIERMRAQFSDQLQSALSEAASREARVAAQLEKALTDNARLLDERNAEVCCSHHSPCICGMDILCSFLHERSHGSCSECKRSMPLRWSKHLKLSCPQSKVLQSSNSHACKCPVTALSQMKYRSCQDHFETVLD